MTQTFATIEEERRVEFEIRDIRRKIETAAWQQSRPFVLRDDDKNTYYFHYRASHRQKQNKIESLVDSDGVTRVDQEDILRIVLSYFKDLFQSPRPPISVDQIVGIYRRVTNDMKSFL